MSYQEEEKNSEESSIQFDSKIEKKENKKDKKRFIVFSLLIFISILMGLYSIIMKPKRNSKINIITTTNIQTKSNTQKDGIAIIDLTGVISHIKRKTNLGIEIDSVTDALVKDFEYYLKNDRVKAIVLQVDSPGGSLVSCEETLKYLKELKEKYPKPIIASFRGVAASGGYYLSMIADKIFANESTLTGSIGVISQFINVSDLMDKYGVKVYTIKSGKNKDSLSPFRAPREDELEYWQNMTTEFVSQFTNVVIESRGEKIKGNKEDIFDGRVFSGKDALKVGLIDSIGTLKDAIKDAASMAKLDDEEPYIITKPIDKNNFINFILSSTSIFSKPKILNPYEEIINSKYIGIPMYIYIPNYIGEN